MELQKRVKRLEITVIILSVALIMSLCGIWYSAIQIKSIGSKIPSYQEIKQDIQTLNNLYKISEQKVPQAYDYTKDKVGKAYDYSKDKVKELTNFISVKIEASKEKPDNKKK